MYSFPAMAEMLGSALVEDAVSRGISFVLGKREEKASQGQLMERLEMAISELEFALERSNELPIRHVSLLQRRKQIKSAYVEAMELRNKHKQQDACGVKRKRWVISPKNILISSSFAGLSNDAVRRFEWFADNAGKFVRDVESGCSLHQYTFCSSIVRHLLKGKSLIYYSEQGNLLRYFFICAKYSDERGVEAMLAYRYQDSTMAEKCFTLGMSIRLSESTDIVGVATKGLQLLTYGFKPATECATGELDLLSNLQDIVHFNGYPWHIEEKRFKHTESFRPDPSCCKGSRHGLCADNNVPSESANIFPEQIIFLAFSCYYVPALEPSSSCSSFDAVAGTSDIIGNGKPPLVLRAAFLPHFATGTQASYTLKIIGDIKECRGATIQQAAETLKSEAINYFLRQPELTEYKIYWHSKHGYAFFTVKNTGMER